MDHLNFCGSSRKEEKIEGERKKTKKEERQRGERKKKVREEQR